MKTLLTNIFKGIAYIMGYRSKNEYPYPFRKQDRKLESTGISHTYVRGVLKEYNTPVKPGTVLDCNVGRVTNRLKQAV